MTGLAFNAKGFFLRREKEIKMSMNTNYWLQWSDSGHVKDLPSISFYFPCCFLKKIDNVHRRMAVG